MSRQTTLTWKVLAKTHWRGRVLAQHTHSKNQLLFATQGVMQVTTDEGQWTVPPLRALWIQAGVAHAVTALSDTEMRTVYFSHHVCVLDTDQVHLVLTSELTRALILALFDPQHLAATQELMAQLLHQLVASCEEPRCYLPLPRDPKLMKAAARLMNHRQWDAPLMTVAAQVGMSERSFTRHFRTEVGCSFRQWRQRARIVGTLDRLVTGDPVKQLAVLAGFANASAYIAAFKEVVGCTPTQFVEQGKHGHG
ncbi:AraC family transcriptional regulator [Limnohabitans sp.]|uniref:AraC family transcriptional regulator n=1 Tax=Limnohabitans sp. TaxID=1907725 RepID=UPI0038B6F17E